MSVCMYDSKSFRSAAWILLLHTYQRADGTLPTANLIYKFTDVSFLLR